MRLRLVPSNEVRFINFGVGMKKWFLTTDDGSLCCLNKLFLTLVIISGWLQTAGLSSVVDRPPFVPGMVGMSLSTASPYLEPMEHNTTVFVGQSTYMACVVKHLGDKTVSWIRKRDLHILTSGVTVYTSDKRVSLIREGKLLNAWTLKIAPVVKKDEGTYVCQVNTEPALTAVFHLIVFGSRDEDHASNGAVALGMLDSPLHQKDEHRSNGGYEAKILGTSSLVDLEDGEVANFTCIISHGNGGGPGLPPPNVTWFLNDIPIHKARRGYSVETYKSSFQSISTLLILHVHKGDEGRYTCGGMLIYPDSVALKVRPHNAHSINSRWKEDYSPSSSSVAPSPVFLVWPLIALCLIPIFDTLSASLNSVPTSSLR